MMNPFSTLSGSIPESVMQIYIIAMLVLVVLGTVIDIVHKKSAEYFFENSRKAKEARVRTLDSSEVRSIVAKTIASDVLTSAEFCKALNSEEVMENS